MKVLQRRWPLSRIIRDSNPPERFLGNALTVTRGLVAPRNSTPIFAPRFYISLVLILSGARSTNLSGQEKFNDPVDQQFISSLDQTSQHYVELRPQGFDAAKPFDVVVTLHGHGSDRWQYIQQERRECRRGAPNRIGFEHAPGFTGLQGENLMDGTVGRCRPGAID